MKKFEGVCGNSFGFQDDGEHPRHSTPWLEGKAGDPTTATDAHDWLDGRYGKQTVVLVMTPEECQTIERNRKTHLLVGDLVAKTATGELTAQQAIEQIYVALCPPRS